MNKNKKRGQHPLLHPSTKKPKHTKITYVKTFASIRPLKSENYRVRVTSGEDRLEYSGNVATYQATLSIANKNLNSTISKEGSQFLGLDKNDFYYGTPMAAKYYEYARIPLYLLSKQISIQYKLDTIAINGIYYVEIRKGITGIQKSDKIAHDCLAKYLAAYGYKSCKRRPFLSKHKT